MTGGPEVAWYTDLTIADPYYTLPILSSLVFLISIELNAADGMQVAFPHEARLCSCVCDITFITLRCEAYNPVAICNTLQVNIAGCALWRTLVKLWICHQFLLQVHLLSMFVWSRRSSAKHGSVLDPASAYPQYCDHTDGRCG